MCGGVPKRNFATRGAGCRLPTPRRRGGLPSVLRAPTRERAAEGAAPPWPVAPRWPCRFFRISGHTAHVSIPAFPRPYTRYVDGRDALENRATVSAGTSRAGTRAAAPGATPGPAAVRHAAPPVFWPLCGYGAEELEEGVAEAAEVVLEQPLLREHALGQDAHEREGAVGLA